MKSLTELDLVKPSETGFEFEYIQESGGPSGVFITVIGSHSGKVKSWVRKELNTIRQRAAMMEKKGKEDIRLVEDDEEFGIRNAAIRIIGWRGITEDYTPELAIKLCEVNPEIRSQVIEKSDELANFTKSK
jgi:hypothetical protein